MALTARRIKDSDYGPAGQAHSRILSRIWMSRSSPPRWFATTPMSAMRRALSAFRAVICANWCWSINGWLTPRSKPSSCGSTTPRPICARRCVAAIREGVTLFRCSCSATRSARRRGAMRWQPRRPVSRSASRIGRRRKPSSLAGPVATPRDGCHRARREKNFCPAICCGDGRGDDCLEGEVATSAAMIAHEAEAVIEAIEPELLRRQLQRPPIIDCRCSSPCS